MIRSAEELLVKIDEVDKLFFSPPQGFTKDFGLTIFPFFTFFDALLERLEIDLRAQRNNHMMRQLFNYRIKSKDLENILSSWHLSIQQQWEGVGRDGSERFVWRFARLKEALSILQMDELQGYRAIYKRLVFELNDAVHPFFIAAGEYWEDTALSSMGMVLGDRAAEALPNIEALHQGIHQLSGRGYIKKLEHLLEKEREDYHLKLSAILRQAYDKVYEQMADVWQLYLADIQQLLRS